MTREIGYGLDLAGYSSGGSALAQAVREKSGETTVTIKRQSVFSKKIPGRDNLQQINQKEIEELQRLLSKGVLTVDVCLDLQGLPFSKSATRVWQLTKRPVDRAYGGLPPLADKIGSYVARMERLRFKMSDDQSVILGSQLFETYPAATLGILNLKSTKYKGKATFTGNRWEGMAEKSTAALTRNNNLAFNLNELRWTADVGTTISHDDFDAAICALTGIARASDRLEGEPLTNEIANKLATDEEIDSEMSHEMTAPEGYRLLQTRPHGVRLELCFNPVQE